MNIFKTKTFWGAVLYAVASVVVDHSAEGVVKAVGAVLTATGLRHAIAKNGDDK